MARQREHTDGFRDEQMIMTLRPKLRARCILLLALAAGCSSSPHGRIVHSHHTREVVLSGEHPTDDFIKARLVAIAEDGTTRILALPSGETLEAPVGGYFVGTNAYGTRGLRLISASSQTGEARLEWMTCGPIRR